MIIEIGSDSHFPAQGLAAIIDRLDKSFHVYSAENFGKRYRLAVSALDSGSIKVVLDALDGLQKIWDAREIFAAFGTHLMEALSILLSGETVAETKDAKVFEAIARPVAMGSATQINLVNHRGDVHVHVGQESAREILKALQHRTVSERGTEAVEPSMIETQSRIAHPLEPGTEGTVWLVGGNWYARLVGGQGVWCHCVGDETFLIRFKVAMFTALAVA